MTSSEAMDSCSRYFAFGLKHYELEKGLSLPWGPIRQWVWQDHSVPPTLWRNDMNMNASLSFITWNLRNLQKSAFRSLSSVLIIYKPGLSKPWINHWLLCVPFDSVSFHQRAHYVPTPRPLIIPGVIVCVPHSPVLSKNDPWIFFRIIIDLLQWYAFWLIRNPLHIYSMWSTF